MALRKPDLHLLYFHLAFGLLCALVLLLLPGMPLGWRLVGLVAVYNIALPLAGVQLGHREWVEIWAFLLPLSVFQVLPDWFLSETLGVLVFPDTGSPFVGAIPVFMAGMWVIPLFLVLVAARRAASRWGQRGGMLAAAGASLAILVTSEATLWALPIWYAQNVFQIAHVALYLLVPEALLGLHAWLGFEWTRQRSLGWRLAAAWSVMTLYTGGVALFYLLFQAAGIR